jgi:hypothetical protein
MQGRNRYQRRNAVTRKQYARPSVAVGYTVAEYKNGRIEEEERVHAGRIQDAQWAEYR